MEPGERVAAPAYQRSLRGSLILGLMYHPNIGTRSGRESRNQQQKQQDSDEYKPRREVDDEGHTLRPLTAEEGCK